MTNPLNLNAPVDTLAMESTRDFDAPVEALFRAHAEPDLAGMIETSPATGFLAKSALSVSAITAALGRLGKSK